MHFFSLRCADELKQETNEKNIFIKSFLVLIKINLFPGAITNTVCIDHMHANTESVICIGKQ